MKEATARIKINKLLESAGWRFFSVRQLTRGQARCRPRARAGRALDVLVANGVGRWAYAQPSRRGGRPAKFFELTVPLEHLTEMMRLAAPGTLNGSRRVRRLAREIVSMLNHYDRTPCTAMADALLRVQRVFASLATSEGERLIPIGRRRIRLTARGAVAAQWNYP